jgi:hypothetical protein
MQIGFYCYVYNNSKATRACLESIRSVYPDHPIVVSCDNGNNFAALCQEKKAIYHHYENRIGYPSTDSGYNKAQLIEWLDRMYRGVCLLNTEFFMMVEEDVKLLKSITLDSKWECVGQPRMYEDQVPPMPAEFLNIIHTFSGVKPIHNYYTTGGGSIFKTQTFLENFFHIRHFLMQNFDFIQQHIYKTIGWMDCMMCVYFMLCGKTLTENHNLYNNFPTIKPLDINSLPKHIEIVHLFKDFYE